MADWEYDLDRNGVPEIPRLVTFDEGLGQRFELWEDGKLIWSEEGYCVHAGYNALFLCVLDGEAYLLRYNPTMYQGVGTYGYRLFSLENGTETVVRESSVDFDTSKLTANNLNRLTAERAEPANGVDKISFPRARGGRKK